MQRITIKTDSTGYDYSNTYETIVKYAPKGFDILRNHLPSIYLQMSPIMENVSYLDIVPCMNVLLKEVSKNGDHRLNILNGLLLDEYKFIHYYDIVRNPDLFLEFKEMLKLEVDLYDNTPEQNKPVDFPGNPFRVWFDNMNKI